MFKNVLVSVSNKKNIEVFVKALQEKYNTRVLSTGGTARHLKEHGIEVVDVSDQTEFPEVMDGRVKTLHPNIHMCLLARDGNAEDQKLLESYNLQPIDLVIGNLYPFEEALNKELSESELCEFIDIGGPSFLRAAAKNYQRIAVVCHPEDYDQILNQEKLTLQDRRKLSAKVFKHVSSYDAMIAESLNPEFTEEHSFGGKKVSQLRYGENPQQQSTWYKKSGAVNGLHKSKILQGKALSYNNLLDLDAAVTTLREFPEKACCISLKHNNPCGVALSDSLVKAVESSLKADPVSVFGGIIAMNREVDKSCAENLKNLFLECIVAPGFSNEALEVFRTKKNLRLLAWPEIMESHERAKIKTIDGGFLVQDVDQVEIDLDKCEVFGETPSKQIWETIQLAWKTCAHLKSNAIALASGQQTVGLGMGQVNRVDAVAQCLERQKSFHPEALDLVLASDAFFPFADSIEKAAEYNVKWIVQPGGSIRDNEVKAKAKELGINLILTGVRHFLH